MWIVTGSNRNQIKLVSSAKTDGLLPVGSYLTVVDDYDIKHILVVEESYPISLFEPSPLVVDAGLPIMTQDQECKNVLTARELRQFPLRTDGRFNIIKPNEKAYQTTQEEINAIFPVKDGYPVFLATNYQQQNAILKGEKNKPIFVKIPFNSLYLQTMVSGQTGSGKTVAMKYLIEQFLENEKGAVFAINVKSNDLLTLDQPTTISEDELLEKTQIEWDTLQTEKTVSGDFSIYMPYQRSRFKEGVSQDKIIKITLRTRDLEPNSLLGVLQNVTDRAAEALPNIFRYWKEVYDHDNKTFREFINWFRQRATRENSYLFNTLSQVGEPSEISLHPGTAGSILRSLESASSFFDSPEEDCVAIDETNILVQNKLSVIDLSSRDTMVFGSILFRHLLSKIYEAKAITGKSDIPVLIVIDEVHQFYKTNASAQALEELNAISRMGRSEKIGVIFASQNPDDLPKGLTTIVNNRIFFRGLENVSRKYGVKDVGVDVTSLESGFALISTVSLPQVKFIKFPIPLMGVQS